MCQVVPRVVREDKLNFTGVCILGFSIKILS